MTVPRCDELDKIETSKEVFLAIWKRHKKDMRVFASYTSDREYETAWGLTAADYPLIHYLAKWEGFNGKSERVNETKRYWLYVNAENKDDDK